TTNPLLVAWRRKQFAIGGSAGDGQHGEAGKPVANPPSVLVVDGGGAPAEGVTVRFVVTAGNGRVKGGVRRTVKAVTGATHVAIATVGEWTLGDVGENELAAIVGTQVVRFRATASAPPTVPPAPTGLVKASSSGVAVPDGAADSIYSADAVAAREPRSGKTK
ncbi:MAG TPA: hypothetical protein VEA99_05580, partial [Gemmatimonadaceae bacterium]|nr:hypothetical protein [Gemmatimonadaceae bacterium]